MRTPSRWLLVAALVLAVSVAFAGYRFATKGGQEVKFSEMGTASWYGPYFHGKRTASGERFNQNDLTAAHRKLPLGSSATVTNLENGKSVEVEINDRGPYVAGRKIDLSKAAARHLGIVDDGTAKVRIEATEDQLNTADPRSKASR